MKLQRLLIQCSNIFDEFCKNGIGKDRNLLYLRNDLLEENKENMRIKNK